MSKVKRDDKNRTTPQELSQLERNIPKLKPIEKVPPDLLGIAMYVSVGLVIILILSWFFGPLPYAITYIKCGEAPIVATLDIAGSGQFYKSGDKGYGPAPFSHYLCSDDHEYTKGVDQ